MRMKLAMLWYPEIPMDLRAINLQNSVLPMERKLPATVPPISRRNAALFLKGLIVELRSILLEARSLAQSRFIQGHMLLL